MIRNKIYKGLIKFFEEGVYFKHFLESLDLSHKDYAFALEIGQGVIKRYQTLKMMSQKLNKGKGLKLKKKERLLLYTAIYQRYFLSKVPLYAIVNETVDIAKKHGMHYFSKFLNAFLKNLPEDFPFETPSSVEELSEYYSYPKYFIEALLSAYSREKAIELLEVGNGNPVNFLRVREGTPPKEYWEAPFCIIENHNELKEYAQLDRFYIQNPSSFYLIKEALPYLRAPKTVLDLCASPGGKALGLIDLMQKPFELTLNDPSKKRLEILHQNIEKYKINTKVTSFLGQEYPTGNLYDLIIIDTPCSNTGTLSRKAEARWRLDREKIQELMQLQKELLNHASKLLSKKGQILYLTCSILPEENKELIEMAESELNLKSISPGFTITPSKQGLDGGFCSVLEKIDT